MSPRGHLVAEWIGFQLVWLACALGAAHGANWPGVAAAAVYLGLVMVTRQWASASILLVLASGVFGLIGESLLAAAGLVRFAAPAIGGSLAPAWIVALWLAFGATLPAISLLLAGRGASLAALIGALTAPPAYWAGARLGALDLVAPAWHALLAIAVLWALALPSLIALEQRCRP